MRTRFLSIASLTAGLVLALGASASAARLPTGASTLTGTVNVATSDGLTSQPFTGAQYTFTPVDDTGSYGADNVIRRWNAVTGDPVDPLLFENTADPLAAYAGDRGADIFRACVACHTLGADQANRAGPTLAGLFGRRIATLPGYDFSDALKRLDIVWTPETVARLFEIGPAAYTPGTKMPEQRIGSEQDRAALVQFLERATKR